jgi:hypothetical protein
MKELLNDILLAFLLMLAVLTMIFIILLPIGLTVYFKNGYFLYGLFVTIPIGAVIKARLDS